MQYAFAPAVLGLVLLQAGCDLENLVSERYREDLEYSHELKPGGRVTIENFNGLVEVLSWEKDEVRITGTKHASTEADLKNLKVETTVAGESVRIRAVRPDRRSGNMGAKLFIRVPRKVTLEQVATSNGGIRVEDIDGDAKLQTSNGSVQVRRVTGLLDARTSNGTIEADDLGGQTTLRTSNGAIRLGRVRGPVDAITSNASVTARMINSAAGEPLRFRSSNGSIDVELESFSGNEVRASTSNSAITLRLPATARATVRAHTSHKQVETDFDVRRAEAQPHRLEGDIGGGGPVLQLTTSNAAIRILKL
jgi:DUF4097 and DUF4098 domain-containing protein YvlB